MCTFSSKVGGGCISGEEVAQSFLKPRASITNDVLLIFPESEHLINIFGASKVCFKDCGLKFSVWLYVVAKWRLLAPWWVEKGLV